MENNWQYEALPVQQVAQREDIRIEVSAKIAIGVGEELLTICAAVDGLPPGAPEAFPWYKHAPDYNEPYHTWELSFIGRISTQLHTFIRRKFA